MRMIFALAIVFSLAWTAAAPAQEKLNHLVADNSPYLKRAIAQPVDWYPRGAAAIGQAPGIELEEVGGGKSRLGIDEVVTL